MSIKFCRLPSVLDASQRSRAAHYKDIQDGFFTKPVRIGGRSVAWPLHEVQRILAARIAGKSDDEIRELVALLEVERKQVA